MAMLVITRWYLKGKPDLDVKWVFHIQLAMGQEVYRNAEQYSVAIRHALLFASWKISWIHGAMVLDHVP